jgi:hydroxyacyl-ACP dehydratase HTD2-like protein with hotdog domain
MIDLRQIAVGETLPERLHKPDNVQLFMYNAALWNAHLIHFDQPYATAVEGYPGLVIAGPLLGDWLHQCVLSWLGDRGRLVSVEYSNRQASYIGETLCAGGEVLAVDASSGEVQVSLYINNEAGENIAPGTATVFFTASIDSGAAQ